MNHVYYRCADCKGSQTWKEGLTTMEAHAEVRWCFGAIKDATMVWIVEDNNNVSPEFFIRDDPTLLNQGTKL